MTDEMNYGGGSWIFAFLIIALIFGGGGFFGGNYAGNDAALSNQISTGFNNQQLNSIALSSANNNYETARLISDQSMLILNQNNTNLVNAIQGFNAVNQNISAQGSAIQQAIADLGYRLDSCCCSIKTQMLQDKYEALQNSYNAVVNDASNSRQSEFLLNTMGRWQAYPPVTTTTA